MQPHTSAVITAIIVLLLLGLAAYLYVGSTYVSTKPSGYADATDPYERPFVINGVLTPKECADIVAHSRGKLFDSETIGSGLNKSVRNSKQFWIKKDDPLVSSLFQKMSTKFNVPVENAEDLQVVNYRPGQFYKEHHDSCCDPGDKCDAFVRRGGQRKLTVLIYLNDAFTEGQTEFKNLGLKMRPNVGDAIVFYPLAKGSEKCHPNALHAGLPVSSGEKWVANLWFREHKFT